MIRRLPSIMKVLNVAEKNDAAKNIAALLSNGTHRTRNGHCVYNKIYEFSYGPLFNQQQVEMKMTSASGHIMSFEFPESCKNWQAINPLMLFDTPVQMACTSDTSRQIKSTLEQEIIGCTHLIVWTDCDREGEAIGFEIIDICRAVRSNIKVWRAKFSEITKPSVIRAINNLAQPDERQNNAVKVRSELDLRIGAAFTRLQTLRIREAFNSLGTNVLSYGSCQFPTLGFVVERYKEIERFRPEAFFKIEVTHKKDDISAEFNWKRGRLFDRAACLVLYERVLENPQMTIDSVDKKPKSKWRPVPMDTVTLEKMASRKLKITAKEALAIAEKLYTEGLISYPRTETNKFPPELKLTPLVQAQTQSPQWGGFASRILDEWGGPNPRNGNKSDQAHPPIHPTKFAQLSLQDNKGKVYELVVRHFLACVSQDARGFETIVNATIDDENFSVNGLQITERNYLDVYPYEKWNAKVIPVYTPGETFMPSGIMMKTGQTSAPNLLTEADLIALMEKHGIGTDATHAEHIDKVKEREYVGLADEVHFVPGQIGMALVDGYDDMGFAMSKPHLRAALERDLQAICDGHKNHNDVLREQIAAYRQVFVNALAQFNKLNEAFAKYLNEAPSAAVVDANGESFSNKEIMTCPKCRNGKLVFRRSRSGDKWFLTCNAGCQAIMWLPSNNLESCRPSSTECPFCESTEIVFQFKPGAYPGLERTYQACVAGCDDTITNLFNLRVVQGSSLNSSNNRPPLSNNSNRNVPHQPRSASNSSSGSGPRRVCGNCRQPGHRRNTCPNQTR